MLPYSMSSTVRRALVVRHASSVAQDKKTPLPILQRPLGVKEPPSTLAQSWEERKVDLLNQEKRLGERKHLVNEISKGYFHDLQATRQYGGKTWIAPNRMIKEDAALYFPDIVGKSLATGKETHTTDVCAGYVSVVAMLSTKISELQTASMAEPTNASFYKDPYYRFVQINVQENFAKSLLVSLFMNSMRKTIPELHQQTYILSSQKLEYIREPLGMVNKHIGYVYLLDEKMRVRWAACGEPKQEETTYLRTSASILLKRLGALELEKSQ